MSFTGKTLAFGTTALSAKYRARNAENLAMEKLKDMLKRFTEEEIKAHWHAVKTVFDREEKREKGEQKVRSRNDRGVQLRLEIL